MQQNVSNIIALNNHHVNTNTRTQQIYAITPAQIAIFLNV